MINIKRYLWRVVIADLLATLLILGLALPVFAIAQPDSPPALNAIYVYENVLEDGDVAMFADYYIDYAVPPTETVTEAYLVIFVDTDGITNLRATAPYVFVASGYGHGCVWIYFTAAEAVTYGLDSTQVANYRVWICGNPTLSWAGGTPPKTVVTIDSWSTIADPSTLIALRVLYYADMLELEWLLDMIEATPEGNKLTAVGQSYFENVIPNLRDIAPACFSSGETKPSLEDIDYTTQFGAVITGGTGTLSVAFPVVLTEGTNSLTATAIGTFIFELDQGTDGTVTSGDATVTGSPADIVAGANTITVIALGATGSFTTEVELVDTTSGLSGSIIGTGWDLTALATIFGMSRWWFSGVVWFVITILICAAVFKGSPEDYQGYSAGKIIFPVFIVCIIGGTLLGLLKPIVAIVLFITIVGFFIGYILFFRGANA